MAGVTGWCSKVDDERSTFGLIRSVGMNRTDITYVPKVNG